MREFINIYIYDWVKTVQFWPMCIHVITTIVAYGYPYIVVYGYLESVKVMLYYVKLLSFGHVLNPSWLRE